LAESKDSNELGGEGDENAANRAFYFLNLIFFGVNEHRFRAAFGAGQNFAESELVVGIGE
jgi:hypothetical protein